MFVFSESQKEKREWGLNEHFEGKMAENVSNLAKDINVQFKKLRELQIG